jgi:hypothetical protein
VIEKVRLERPQDYLRVGASLLPKQMDVETDRPRRLTEYSNEELLANGSEWNEEAVERVLWTGAIHPLRQRNGGLFKSALPTLTTAWFRITALGRYGRRQTLSREGNSNVAGFESHTLRHYPLVCNAFLDVLIFSLQNSTQSK